jgi:hypothetical protein
VTEPGRLPGAAAGLRRCRKAVTEPGRLPGAAAGLALELGGLQIRAAATVPPALGKEVGLVGAWPPVSERHGVPARSVRRGRR